MKTCAKCGETKDRNGFHVRSVSLDRLAAKCKECVAAYDRKRYLVQGEEIRRRSGDWYWANREDARAWAREHHKHNAERIRAKTRRWYQENKEYANAYSMQWEKDNPEKRRAIIKRREARKHSLPSTFTSDEWEEILEMFGNRCIYCGNPGKMEQDHFLPVALGGGYVRGNIVPACKTCNTTKNSKHPRLFVEEGRLKQPFRQLLVKLCYA
ncbi:hypothetical protein LCGC14_0922020 [marine sediment metagenome]|uniref:HNH nuclease domain-containing protein n=1 Tax=marine sediment metagenome TaxID=412755 RepID=A0A0F9R9D5_9ZZZZ